MRKTIIAVLILAVMSSGKDINLNDIPTDAKYIEIVGTKMMTKLAISVDYGQHWKERGVIRRDGKKYSFNSMIDVLNFFDKMGWKYRDSYAISHGNSLIYHYLLER